MDDHAQPRRTVLASFDANSCNGKVTFWSTMTGMGIIKIRKAQGNKTRGTTAIHETR